MPEYKVAKRSFINGRLHEPGDIVTYDGEPGSNLVSVDASLSEKIVPASAEELTELDDLRKQSEGEDRRKAERTRGVSPHNQRGESPFLVGG